MADKCLGLFRAKPARSLRRNIGAFDIETDGLNAKKFILGVVYDGNAFYDFDDNTDMLEFMCQRQYRGKIWYAHNAEYDLTGLIPGNILQDMDCLFSGSRFIMARKQLTGKNCVTFADSFNIFPVSLKKLGLIIGVEKHEINFNDCTKDKLREYCRQDTKIVFDAMIWFKQSVYDMAGCNIGMTLASTALKVFRTKFLHDFWRLPFESSNQFFRQSYYGGRCEVFIKGKISQPIYHYDINSLYPTAMLKAQFPHPNGLKVTNIAVKDLPDFMQRYAGAAHVTVKSPGLHLPILPYRQDSKLIFPVGQFTGIYQFSELSYAMQHGYEILDCHKVIYSRESYNPFAEFVNDMYKRRLEYQAKKNPMEYIVKLILNSLYGKFGECHTDKVYGYDYEREKYKHGSFYPIDVKTMWGYFTHGKPEFTDHTFYQLCAAVTAQSRIILYDYFKRLPAADIIYCDTDSIFSLSPLPADCVGAGLGLMKREGIYESGIFLKPKMYSVGDYTKIKGIPKSSADITQTTFTFNRLCKSKESLRRNLIPGSPLTVTKTLQAGGDKRIIKYELSDYLKKSSTTLPITIIANV